MCTLTQPPAFLAPVLGALPRHTCRAKPISSRRPRCRVFPRSCAAAAQPSSTPSDRDFTSANANVNTPPPPTNGPSWETISGCDVFAPSPTIPPAAIVRFTGGFVAGSAPRRLYGAFLEQIAIRGNVAIIAAPVGTSLNHSAMAARAAESLGAATRTMVARYPVPWIPCFGMGHSLGSKLQVLAACDAPSRAAQGPVVANLLMSFNNFSAKDSMPQWDEFAASLGGSEGVKRSAKELGKLADFLRDVDIGALTGGRVPVNRVGRASDWLRTVGDGIESFAGGVADRSEMSPSPEEVMSIIGARYSVPDNLVLSFSRDDLDQSEQLKKVLTSRFGAQKTVVRQLDGTHVTPLTPRFKREESDGFASVGSQKLDDEIRKAASGVNKELDKTVAVVVAFLRLHLEVLAKKNMVP